VILAIDVGNTRTTIGVLDDTDVVFAWHTRTERHSTSDEFAIFLMNLLKLNQVEPETIEGGILSTVVPAMKATISSAVAKVTGQKIMVVGPGVKNGLKIRIDNPAQLGSRSVANAVAAAAEYDMPAIIFDISTAITISVLDESGSYRGGMITPGPQISLDALIQRTSQLPQISLNDKPGRLIGTNTEDCMRSGLVYGYASMIDGLVRRIRKDRGTEHSVIITGASAGFVRPYCEEPLTVDEDLMLKGLRIIYNKNKKGDPRA